MASLGADIVEGRAEAQWTPADPRKPDDTRELRYRLQVTGSRCRKAAGGEVQVRNPRVVSMEWEEDFAYPGDTVKLKVTSFEMSEFHYKMKLNFYDYKKFAKSEVLFSKELIIDEDEKNDEKNIEIDIPEDELNLTYKDDAGYCHICVEGVVESIDYIYIESKTLETDVNYARD